MGSSTNVSLMVEVLVCYRGEPAGSDGDSIWKKDEMKGGNRVVELGCLVEMKVWCVDCVRKM